MCAQKKFCKKIHRMSVRAFVYVCVCVALTEVFGQLNSPSCNQLRFLLVVLPEILQHLLHVLLQAPHCENDKTTSPLRDKCA